MTAHRVPPLSSHPLGRNTELNWFKIAYDFNSEDMLRCLCHLFNAPLHCSILTRHVQVIFNFLQRLKIPAVDFIYFIVWEVFCDWRFEYLNALPIDYFSVIISIKNYNGYYKFPNIFLFPWLIFFSWSKYSDDCCLAYWCSLIHKQSQQEIFRVRSETIILDNRLYYLFAGVI